MGLADQGVQHEYSSSDYYSKYITIPIRHMHGVMPMSVSLHVGPTPVHVHPTSTIQL